MTQKPVTASRAVRPFLPAWALVLSFIAFVAILLAVKAFVIPEPYRDIDFSSYWAAARTAFVEKASPYGAGALQAARERSMPDRMEVPPFLYTPVALLAFGPLQWLEPLPAARALFALNLLALVAMMAFLVRTVGQGGSRRFAWTSAGYILLFAPLYETISAGQINLLLMLLVVGVWHVYRSGRAPAAGGLAAALVVFIKLHLGLLLLPVLLRRRVSLLVASTVSLILGVGLSAAVFSFDAWGGWLEHIVRASSVVQVPRGLPTIAGPMNLSIPGMTARFLVQNPLFPTLAGPPWLASAVPSLLCALVLGWTAVVLWRSSRVPQTSELASAELCLALGAAFELSPLSWGHHLVFLLPALLLLLRHAVLEPGASPTARAVLAFLIVLLPLNPFVFGPLSPPVSLAVATLRSLAAIVVWAVTSARVLRLARAQAPEEAAPSGDALLSAPPSP
ncbi:glycosyltransferase family 87 protein [Pyxidicoccus sp. MSG2]|uniref:glycosyltransferase family 87 protein n=1 Tax=Pyxidicoccus sp. MSG2 TaxID=2996790 RepID=UPI0022708FE9|nr:glycosyltransferase family 87 protein [Pyxidicoccus sp. MSG2]MCY1022987.1 glycosyltransferase family 87 protein [Pyxidicoccus sp. MSG2]